MLFKLNWILLILRRFVFMSVACQNYEKKIQNTLSEWKSEEINSFSLDRTYIIKSSTIPYFFTGDSFNLCFHELKKNCHWRLQLLKCLLFLCIFNSTDMDHGSTSHHQLTRLKNYKTKLSCWTLMIKKRVTNFVKSQ